MASEAPAPDAQLGEKNLSTIHAVAQALAIGPMFSVALVLGAVSGPVNGRRLSTPRWRCSSPASACSRSAYALRFRPAVRGRRRGL